MKKFLLWLHKWLGLITGVIIVVVSLTGCIYVFQSELRKIAYPTQYYIQEDQIADNHKTLPFSVLMEKAEKALGNDFPINRVNLYPSKDRTWIFRSLQVDKEAFGYWEEVVHYKRVFINPYSGEIQAIENTKNEFFYIILQLHRNLLLGSSIGSWIVGGSTVLFLIISITGIVLWWPKKWKGKAFRRSYQFDFSVNWKRINYDLHNILGMYSLLIALIIGYTGIVFSFPKFKQAVEFTLNKIDESKFSRIAPTVFDQIPQKKQSTIDNALYYVLDKYNNADMMSIRLSNDDNKPHSIQIRLDKDKTSLFQWYYFDKQTGEIVSKRNHKYNSIALGTKINSLNYDLHVGSIGGYTTKILAFLGSLICASLPITGFIIWYNKFKKKKKRKA